MGTVQVDRIIDRHGRERSSLIAILQDIQDEFNWINDEHLRHVATELGLPLTQVFGVASFYRALSLEPRGKSILKVCMGTACHVRGAPLIADELGRQLEIEPGQTTPDLEYTLEVVNCVGACGMAPVVIVDDKYHPGVKPHRAKKLVKGKGKKDKGNGKRASA
jgi:NADH-quinone oxidoreductase subunit E